MQSQMWEKSLKLIVKAKLFFLHALVQNKSILHSTFFHARKKKKKSLFPSKFFLNAKK